MPVTRRQVVETARAYVNTPFKHQGRLKGIACDCVGLPYMIADDLGLSTRDGKPVRKDDNSSYSAQPTDDVVLKECQRLLIEKPVDAMQEGDVLVLRMLTVPCHTAIVSKLYVGTPDECFGVIHSYQPAGKVIETVLDAKTRNRIAGAFAIPGVID